ncbi:hypothetical protein BDY24DRAFT_411501 [Mrakia frigida]|uniref:uncharacterized protein n=1 Tax=Mrakia frigida TaxID=29902 RepID=UPI003FCC0D83
MSQSWLVYFAKGVYNIVSSLAAAAYEAALPGDVIGGQDGALDKEGKYQQLRERARKEGDLMRSCFERSQQAYQSGNKKAAYELSQEGKRIIRGRRLSLIRRFAQDWIFSQNNLTQPLGTTDLHGLYVREAVEVAEAEIRKAQGRGDRGIRFIVGKGNNSSQQISKLKPAIEQLMEKYNLDAQLDPLNSGLLIVKLDAGRGGERRGSLLVGEMEKREGACMIM